MCYGVLHLGGLSPRGRGNRRGGVQLPSVTRSIPAWAGEPINGDGWWDSGKVYPRVGGGTLTRQRLCHSTEGLSPRGRGNRLFGLRGTIPARSIPAWAGEPSSGALLLMGKKVYPRVGGGTASATYPLEPMSGLSPRGRGNRPFGPSSPRGPRSIPAWAGEPPARLIVSINDRVYPRVGGGTVSLYQTSTS